MSAPYERLTLALETLQAPIEVFFRDDDGGWNDGALQQLVGIFAAARVTLDVAVIPQALEASMARWLAARFGPSLGLHQHGFTHANHEPGGRKCEFGAARDLEAQRSDIDAGARRLRDLLRLEPDPIFTPPWNRCTELTARALGELGFQALSRDAGAAPIRLPEGLQQLSVIIDWMKYRIGNTPDVAELIERFHVQILAAPRIGVMLHHAVMGRGDHEVLQSILSVLGSHPNVRCLPMRTLAVPARGALAA